ncbi:hypothetical protein JCM3770_005385 [Rhodotorula araucariae]
MAPLLYPRPLRTCPPAVSESSNPHIGSASSSSDPLPLPLPLPLAAEPPQPPPPPTRTLLVPPQPRRSISAPAPASAPVPALAATASGDAGGLAGDDAVEELRAIFARAGALDPSQGSLSVAGQHRWLVATPRAASTATNTTTSTSTNTSTSTATATATAAAAAAAATKTILLPLSSSTGGRTPSRSGARSRAHGRRKSSGGGNGNGTGTGTANGAAGAGEAGDAGAGAARSKRTPPGVWGGWDAVLHSPPSRALTRNPFPRHAHSALPVLQLGGAGTGSPSGDEGGAFAARLRTLRSEFGTGIVGTGAGGVGLESEVVQMAVDAEGESPA